MVTLKPGHPPRLAPPAGLTGNPGKAVKPVDKTRRQVPARPARPNRKRGIHRARRQRYKSVHRHPRRGRIARRLPAWGSRPSPSALPLSQPRPAVPPAAPPRSEGSRDLPRSEAAVRTDNPPRGGANPADARMLPDAGPAENSPPADRPVHSGRPASPVEKRRTENPVAAAAAAPAPGANRAPGADRAAAAPSDDPWAQSLSLDKVSADPSGGRGNTGDTIRRLWEASANMEMEGRLLTYGVPGPDLDASMSANRRRRRRLVISILVLIGLGAGAAKVLNDLPVREANAREEQYAAAARRLSGAVAPVEEALAAEGWLSDSGLSTLTGRLNTLDGAARAASVLAAEQLPRPPIVGSTAPIEDLVLPKQMLEWSSIQALGVGRRVGDAMAYSLSLSTVFYLPDLPTEAPREEVGAIAEQLSLSIAETRQVLAALPEDPLFGAYRQQAADAVTMVETYQADYIAALLEGDSDRAAAVSGAMNDSMSVLREALDAPLGEVQTWALDRITELHLVAAELEKITAA